MMALNFKADFTFNFFLPWHLFHFQSVIEAKLREYVTYMLYSAYVSLI